jgi:hypothetical protein
MLGWVTSIEEQNEGKTRQADLLAAFNLRPESVDQAR